MARLVLAFYRISHIKVILINVLLKIRYAKMEIDLEVLPFASWYRLILVEVSEDY